MLENYEVREIGKFGSKFTKQGYKLLKKLSLNQYLRTLGSFQPVSVNLDHKDLIVTSTAFSNLTTRRTIVKTLQNINYKRDSKWTEQAAIGFMEEVISLYLYEGDDEYIKDQEKDISIRYNVPVNRLKTQIALFLNNLETGKDKFNILEYFSVYDLVKWKYRDLNKLQEDIEANKIDPRDYKALKELNIIE